MVSRERMGTATVRARRVDTPMANGYYRDNEAMISPYGKEQGGRYAQSAGKRVSYDY